MDRDQLISALAGAGEAARLCREALLAGAELEVSPRIVATSELRAIYRSRAEHLRAQGTPAVGADEAADELDRTAFPELRIARVTGGAQAGTQSGFQVFLDQQLGRVITCVALPPRGQ